MQKFRIYCENQQRVAFVIFLFLQNYREHLQDDIANERRHIQRDRLKKCFINTILYEFPLPY